MSEGRAEGMYVMGPREWAQIWDTKPFLSALGRMLHHETNRLLSWYGLVFSDTWVFS